MVLIMMRLLRFAILVVCVFTGGSIFAGRPSGQGKIISEVFGDRLPKFESLSIKLQAFGKANESTRDVAGVFKYKFTDSEATRYDNLRVLGSLANVKLNGSDVNTTPTKWESVEEAIGYKRDDYVRDNTKGEVFSIVSEPGVNELEISWQTIGFDDHYTNWEVPIMLNPALSYLERPAFQVTNPTGSPVVWFCTLGSSGNHFSDEQLKAASGFRASTLVATCIFDDAPPPPPPPPVPVEERIKAYRAESTRIRIAGAFSFLPAVLAIGVFTPFIFIVCRAGMRRLSANTAPTDKSSDSESPFS
jgi:hypothetical protein